MARRRRALFTQKKKVSGKKSERATPDGLSARQFAALAHDYGSFVVEDSEHEQHQFALDDTAYFLHEGSKKSGDDDKDNHWIGKIKEIRGNNPSDVWIRVEWFWSPHEVAEVIKSFICGEHEKLSSNNYDFLSVHCVVGHAAVKVFDEVGIYQEPIGDEEWFSRYFFHYDARRITPKVAHHACSICKVPYTPGVDKIHHFCPRPSCCNFYHQACLVKNGYVEETRTRSVLETWPNLDRTVSVDELTRYHPGSRKRQKRDHSPSKKSVRDPLADFPQGLVALAGQRILRGVQGGGVVGNIHSVTAARQLIFTTLTAGGNIPEGWDTRINTSTAFPDPDTLPNCICPSCYSAI